MCNAASLQQNLDGRSQNGAPVWTSNSSGGTCTAEDVYKDADWMMRFFKVVSCTKRTKHEWVNCPFLHESERARRRCLYTYKYSAKLCPDVQKEGNCPRGDACDMSHNCFELWLHPQLYHTQMCRDGSKCQRRVCFFAHSTAELREPSDTPPEYAAAAISATAATATAAEVATSRNATSSSRLGAGCSTSKELQQAQQSLLPPYSAAPPAQATAAPAAAQQEQVQVCIVPWFGAAGTLGEPLHTGSWVNAIDNETMSGANLSLSGSIAVRSAVERSNSTLLLLPTTSPLPDASSVGSCGSFKSVPSSSSSSSMAANGLGDLPVIYQQQQQQQYSHEQASVVRALSDMAQAVKAQSQRAAQLQADAQAVQNQVDACIAALKLLGGTAVPSAAAANRHAAAAGAAGAAAAPVTGTALLWPDAMFDGLAPDGKIIVPAASNPNALLLAALGTLQAGNAAVIGPVASSGNMGQLAAVAGSGLSHQSEVQLVRLSSLNAAGLVREPSGLLSSAPATSVTSLSAPLPSLSGPLPGFSGPMPGLASPVLSAISLAPPTELQLNPQLHVTAVTQGQQGNPPPFVW